MIFQNLLGLGVMVSLQFLFLCNIYVLVLITYSNSLPGFEYSLEDVFFGYFELFNKMKKILHL